MRRDAAQKERGLRWHLDHHDYHRRRNRSWHRDRDHADWYADEAVRCRKYVALLDSVIACIKEASVADG
eukprot:4373429-Alexandrium_andersonii.AAC.1